MNLFRRLVILVFPLVFVACGKTDGVAPSITSSLAKNYAGSFNGASSYIEIIHQPRNYPMAAPLTLEAFVQPASIGAVSYIMHWHNIGGTANAAIYIDMGGHFVASISANCGGVLNAAGTTVASVGSQYHVALSWDGAQNLQVYVNGIREANTATPAPGNCMYDRLTVAINGSSSNSYFSGVIDEARLSTSQRYVGPSFTPQRLAFSVDQNTLYYGGFSKNISPYSLAPGDFLGPPITQLYFYNVTSVESPFFN